MFKKWSTLCPSWDNRIWFNAQFFSRLPHWHHRKWLIHTYEKTGRQQFKWLPGVMEVDWLFHGYQLRPAARRQKQQWHGKGPLPPNLLVRPLMNGVGRRPAIENGGLQSLWDETTKDLQFCIACCTVIYTCYSTLFTKGSRFLLFLVRVWLRKNTLAHSWDSWGPGTNGDRISIIKRNRNYFVT